MIIRGYPQTSKIEVTTKQVFGYVLLAAGIILFFDITLNAILLATGTLQPIKVEMSNPGYGNDVFAGIILQIGLFGVLTAVAFAIAKIGLSIIKD
jgi:hypothetical protein